jgi:hypothetical protein
MMAASHGDITSTDLQTPHLQAEDLAYWNAMQQIYGQEVQQEHAPQLQYYTNGHEFTAAQPEIKVQFCSCGKVWDPAANFCANCGAKRPAKEDEEKRSSPDTSGVAPEMGHESIEDGATHREQPAVDQVSQAEQQVNDETTDPDARALSDDIAAQVARFLQGDACDSDEEEEETTDVQSALPDIPPEKEIPGLSAETVPQIEFESIAADRKANPSFMRGVRFVEKFRYVPLNMDGQDLNYVADTIVACVETLYKEKTRPLVRNVQRLLYLRGIAKRIVQCVIGICVRFPKKFEIWLPPDMHPCILLPWQSVEQAGLDSEKHCQARYEYDFLAELAAWVHKTPVQSHAKMQQLTESSTEVKSNEKKKDSAAASKQPVLNSSGSARAVSTLMLRNIPVSLSNARLEQEIQDSGFDGAYDFIHCPRDINKGSGAGYAFVNFISPDLASKFALAWHATNRFGEPTAINVSAAQQQGLEANLKKWSGSRLTRLKNPGLRPIVRINENSLPSQK